MGSSIDCELNYGVVFNVGEVEFPWNDEEFDSDIDDWWLREVLKWKPVFRGNYFDLTSKQRDANYKSKKEALIETPVPARVVFYGNLYHYESDEIMLAVGDKINSYGGEPERIIIEKLDEIVSVEEADKLLKFCKKYIGKPKEMGWFMSGSYG